MLSARVNQYVGTATLATQNVTTLATNYTLTFTGTGTITLSGTATGAYSAGTHTITCTAGTLTSTVTGTVTNADIRVANVGVGLPVYQRVTTSTDYDTVSYPFFLRFDGVDDFLVTNSIDFTATDKMTVAAGVRKLSSAASSADVEWVCAIVACALVCQRRCRLRSVYSDDCRVAGDVADACKYARNWCGNRV